MAQGHPPIPAELTLCPRCSQPTQGHGRYERGVWGTPDRKKKKVLVDWIPILRRRCPPCRRTISLLPSFLAPRRRFSLGVLAPLVHAYVVLGESVLKILAAKANRDLEVSKCVLEGLVGWLAGRASELEATLTRRLAEVAPSHEFHWDERLGEVAGSLLRSPALRRLRRVLLLAEHLRQLVPHSYPPTLAGGLVAVLMCVMPPGLL